MRKHHFYILLHAVALLVVATAAHAETGLAPISKDQSLRNKVVPDDQTGQTYAVPSGTDLVRTEPTDTSWTPNYKFTAWNDVPAGGHYEVCTDDVPVGSLVAGDPYCHHWGYIAKAGAAGNGRTTLTWTLPTLYTDGSSIPASKVIAINVYRGSLAIATIDKRPTGVLLTAEPYGVQCYSITAVIDNIESASSGTGCKTVRVPAPTDGRISAPTGGIIK